MKLLIPLLLLTLSLRAQTICIPLALGDSLERDIQRMYKLDSLAKIRGERIIVLTKELNLKDSTIWFYRKELAVKDTISKDKDAIIAQQLVVIKNQTKGKVKWWWVPIGFIVGALISR